MWKTSILKSLAIALTLSVVFAASARASGIVFSTFPSSQPPDVFSWAFEQEQTREFGDIVQLAGVGSAFSLDSFSVMVSNWGTEALYPGIGAGFTLPMTLNLYNVGAGNSVGSLFATQTTSQFIPVRPAADPTCDLSDQYRAIDSNCYNGQLSTVTFGLSGLVVPQTLIYGVSFNTRDYGYPGGLGVSGPYDSLNLAWTTASPSVGSDPLADDMYLATFLDGFYSDPSAVLGVFQHDSNYTPYLSPIVEIAGSPVEIVGSPVPEPASLTLLGGALAGMAVQLRRRRNARQSRTN